MQEKFVFIHVTAMAGTLDAEALRSGRCVRARLVACPVPFGFRGCSRARPPLSLNKYNVSTIMVFQGGALDPA